MIRSKKTSDAQACYEHAITIPANAAFAGNTTDSSNSYDIAKKLVSSDDVIVFRPSVASASACGSLLIKAFVTADDPGDNEWEVTLYVTNLTAANMNRPEITGHLVFLA